jgi:hypothetical protein
MVGIYLLLKLYIISRFEVLIKVNDNALNYNVL